MADRAFHFLCGGVFRQLRVRVLVRSLLGCVCFRGGVLCRCLFCCRLCGCGFRLGVGCCGFFGSGLGCVCFRGGVLCRVRLGVRCGLFGLVGLCGGCGSVCGCLIGCGLGVGCVVVGLVCRLLGGLGGGLEGVQRLLDAGCCCVGFGDFQRDLFCGLSNKAFCFLGGAVLGQLAVGVLLASLQGLVDCHLAVCNGHVGLGDFQLYAFRQGADLYLCFFFCEVVVFQHFLSSLCGDCHGVGGCHFRLGLLQLGECLLDVGEFRLICQRVVRVFVQLDYALLFALVGLFRHQQHGVAQVIGQGVVFIALGSQVYQFRSISAGRGAGLVQPGLGVLQQRSRYRVALVAPYRRYNLVAVLVVLYVVLTVSPEVQPVFSYGDQPGIKSITGRFNAQAAEVQPLDKICAAILAPPGVEFQPLVYGVDLQLQAVCGYNLLHDLPGRGVVLFADRALFGYVGVRLYRPARPLQGKLCGSLDGLLYGFKIFKRCALQFFDVEGARHLAPGAGAAFLHGLDDVLLAIRADVALCQELGQPGAAGGVGKIQCFVAILQCALDVRRFYPREVRQLLVVSVVQFQQQSCPPPFLEP